MEVTNNDDGEKIILSFSIKNCLKDYYYKISVFSENENFETEKIRCEIGGDNISFEKKLNFTFQFVKRQPINIIVEKQNVYGKEGNDLCNPINIRLSNLLLFKGAKYETKLNEFAYNSETILIEVYKNKDHLEKRYLFDYLKLGIKLSCFISFDFSKKGKSLIKDINFNILKYIFHYLEDYIDGHSFYPKGFGAKIKNSKELVFDMSNFNIDSDKLKEKYKEYLESSNIIPEKKVLLSPLIKKVTNEISLLNKSNIYNVLFVLLSSGIDKKDKQSIFNLIMASSFYLPLTIVVIGVGDHDFSREKEIFEQINKFSSQGKEKSRNNVIFVSLKNPNSASQITSLCLRELSKQIIEFYDYIEYYPENDEKENKKNFTKSVSLFGSVTFNDNLEGEEQIIEKKNSTPIGENKMDLEGNPTPNPDIFTSDDYSNSNSINTNPNNKNNNVNISNNSNTKYSLKGSIESCPMTPVNPYLIDKMGKDENLQKMKNNSGGIQFKSNKSSDLKTSDS